MSALFKIEKGVELPRARARTGQLSEAFRALAVGDSFVMPKKTRNCVSQYAQRFGIKCETRSVDDQTIRVWRVA
jgi:hypothetical protein